MTWAAQVWLVRHGEVTSYLGDHGLTERGEAQAREAAAELAGELGTHAEVDLRHAPSGRATGTARVLGPALRDAGVQVGPPEADPGFENFRVDVRGEVQAHDAMRLALAEAGEPDGPAPTWRHEGARFAAIHDGGGDPITWWLTQPTLAYEPAALVVRRYWRALGARAAAGRARTVVCCHSGPMRALAAQALGRDPGEPEHLERVVVRMAGGEAGAPAQVAYRGETVPVVLPRLEEPAWS